MHQPSSGTISFQGKPVTLADPSAALTLGIATVFQDLALCENLDIVANIFLGRELSPLRLDEVAMEVRAWTLLNELSARIPSVRDRGLGVVIVSHNMEDVRAVADRIVVLRLGRNNGIFTPDASNQELVSAITGASDNSVSRRAERRQAGQDQPLEPRP